MSLLDEEVSLDMGRAPLYYQGKFMPDQSLSSAAVSERSLRPAMYGTLTAADLGTRGSFQMPGKGNGAPNGVFNLPRYYPKYRTFSRSEQQNNGFLPTSNGSWGNHHNGIPFYKDDPYDVDRVEPIYSKPNKSRASRPPQTETFTVAVGSDFDSRSRDREKGCCSKKVVVIALIVLLLVVLIAVAIFLAVYLTRKDDSEPDQPDKEVSLSALLKIDAVYQPDYNDLNANSTKTLSAKICDAYETSLQTISSDGKEVATFRQCFAANYTNGSIFALHFLSFLAKHDVNIDSIRRGVEKMLNESVVHINGPFYRVMNASVSLMSVELQSEEDIATTTTDTTVINSTNWNTTSRPRSPTRATTPAGVVLSTQSTSTLSKANGSVSDEVENAENATIANRAAGATKPILSTTAASVSNETRPTVGSRSTPTTTTATSAADTNKNASTAAAAAADVSTSTTTASRTSAGQTTSTASVTTSVKTTSRSTTHVSSVTSVMAVSANATHLNVTVNDDQ